MADNKKTTWRLVRKPATETYIEATNLFPAFNQDGIGVNEFGEWHFTYEYSSSEAQISSGTDYSKNIYKLFDGDCATATYMTPSTHKAKTLTITIHLPENVTIRPEVMQLYYGINATQYFTVRGYIDETDSWDVLLARTSQYDVRTSARTTEAFNYYSKIELFLEGLYYNSSTFSLSPYEFQIKSGTMRVGVKGGKINNNPYSTFETSLFPTFTSATAITEMGEWTVEGTGWKDNTIAYYGFDDDESTNVRAAGYSASSKATIMLPKGYVVNPEQFKIKAPNKIYSLQLVGFNNATQAWETVVDKYGFGMGTGVYYVGNSTPTVTTTKWFTGFRIEFSGSSEAYNTLYELDAIKGKIRKLYK